MTTQVMVLCLSLMTLMGGCGMCGNEEVKRTSSPDGVFDAVLFQRDCGATTGFSTQVSIVRAGANLPDAGGNVFVADCDQGRAPSASWGGPPADIVWLDTRTLAVHYHPASRVSRRTAIAEVRNGWFASETIALVFKQNLAGQNFSPGSGKRQRSETIEDVHAETR